jgi:hypothetical protein
VAIVPGHATLLPGGVQPFSANQNVTWKVQEGASAGSITPAGLYTAPQTTGVFHVVATSAADTTMTAAAEVDVVSSLNPAPFVQSMTPVAAAPGGALFTITVNGTGFVASSKAQWNGGALATTFVSSVKLKADVPASLTVGGTVGWVTVMNPAPGGGTSNVLFFPVTNSSSTVQFSRTRFKAGDSPSFVALGDFNGDGKLDVALANNLAQADTVSIMLGNGDGTFQLPQGFDVGQGPSSIAIGDFDGDGKLDLVVTNLTDNTVSILLGNGDGTFQTQQTYATGAAPISLVVGDFNGDGKLDLAIADRDSNDIAVLTGNGDGSFQTAQVYSAGAHPQALALGDFNGDGKLDLAVTNLLDNTVSVLFGNGDGTFQSQQIYNTGSEPSSIATGDFNGDGNLDLAVSNAADGTVSIYLGNGTGTFQPQQTYAAGNFPNSVSVGDLNGDGKLDLAIANSNDGTTSVLLGNGDGTFPPQTTFSGALQLSVAIGDFTATGRLAFSVAEPMSQRITVWLQSPLFSPASLAFGNQSVGSTSSKQTITVTNNSTASLSVTGVTIAGANNSDFGQTNTCPASLSANANCTIDITFAPTAAGARSGAASIAGNWPGSPQLLSLAGTGVGVGGVPATITATSGSGQSAVVNTAFTSPLQATVTDNRGNPVPGVTVTFTAPAQTGPSGAFASGPNTAVTNGGGVATSALFTANGNVGPYAVTAMAGTIGPASFSLTNTAVAPATITATAGSGQSAPIKTAFGTALQATVKDSTGNPVPNVTVTFTAPASGPSGAFAGGANTAVTSASGVATSATFTANGTFGSYSVTAKVGTVGSASFSLTNVDFRVVQDSSTSGTIQVTAGTPAAVKLDVDATGPLPADVNFACSAPLPAGTSCTFNPPTLTAGSPAVSSTTLKIRTTSSSGVMGWLPPTGRRGPWASYLLRLTVTALLAMMTMFVGYRQRTLLLPRWLTHLSLVLLAITIAGLMSCSSGGSGGPGPGPTPTPKGPSSITVTATSGGDSQPIAININVN